MAKHTYIYIYIYIVVFHSFLSTVVVKIGVQPLRIKRWEDCTVLTEDCRPDHHEWKPFPKNRLATAKRPMPKGTPKYPKVNRHIDLNGYM